MSLRVSIESYGTAPIVFIAPHGPDDHNTAKIADYAANTVGGYVIANNGFVKGDVVDEINDIANCNRVDHCSNKLIINEFLNPIKRIKNKILTKHSKAYLFYIHGCSDEVYNTHNAIGVIGMGLGTKLNSITMGSWEVAYLIDKMQLHYEDDKFLVAKGGHKYAARESNNMNQYFTKHEKDVNVKSIQIELPYIVRKSNNYPTFTYNMSGVINDVVQDLIHSRNNIKKQYYNAGQKILDGSSSLLI